MKLFEPFFPHNVQCHFSDRTQDFRAQGTAEMIKAQQYFLRSCFPTGTMKSPLQIRQVHGDNVVVIGNEAEKKSYQQTEADGLVTNQADTGLLIRTADCLSVFLYDPRRRSMGLIHAGWRGSQKKIVPKACRILHEHWGADLQELKVGFGPAIRSCCYEVGEEFQQIFPKAFQKRAQRIFLDLIKVNREQLLELGVTKENINDCQCCTCCDPRFFSYRREGAKAGRHASLMFFS